MAPTAKMKTADPKPTTASKSKGRDRIVKRRARGFHRFRNGMLNVTPKGGEKELYSVLEHYNGSSIADCDCV